MFLSCYFTDYIVKVTRLAKLMSDPFCFASFLSFPQVLRVGPVELDLDFFLLEVLGSVESNAQLYLFFIMAIWSGIMVLLLCTLIIILFKMDICVLGFSMWF